MERKTSTDILFNFVFIILTSIFVPVFCQGEKLPRSVEYAYPDQSVWTTKTNASGVLENPLLHLVGALFSELDIQWTAKPYPANRMFERLQEGKSNFSMLVQAARLKESCIFSKEPIVSTELRVYRTAGSTPITDIEDLKGKKIITIRGYSYGAIGKYLNNESNGIVTFEAPLHKSAFTMLANGRADYLLDYSGPSKEILEANPIPGVSSDLIKKLGVYFVLSKSYPGAQKLMDDLEKAVAAIDISQWNLDRP